ncbi:alternative splicing regulator-domain-containing protein [Dichotomocladium elegans]|nr:alternative splicing regulator-domain-containing protein [Dichotomocladium elegans]
MEDTKGGRPIFVSEQLLKSHDQCQRKRQKNKHDDSDLIIFGYEARIFNDPVSARKVERGEYLVPWKNELPDTTGIINMMDRFDVRHLLEAIPPTTAGGWDKAKIDQDESAYDEERYIDLDSDEELYYDMSEDDRDAHIETKRRRRQRQEEEKKTFYSYDYQGNGPKPVEERNSIQKALALQFRAPPKMQLPDNQEQADVIAMTAKSAAASVNPKLFEIKTQARQSNNPLYSFLNRRNTLYPFYTHLVWLSSSGLGAYGDTSSSEDEKEDDERKQPPPAVAQVIDKTAQAVARAGDALEKRIRERNGTDAKFSFIHQGHEYHPYYRSKVEYFQRNLAQ